MANLDSIQISGTTYGLAAEEVNGYKVMKLTQAQYDALSPDYDANTIYYIVN